MRKHKTAFIVTFLAFTLILTLTACNGSGGESSISDESVVTTVTMENTENTQSEFQENTSIKQTAVGNSVIEEEEHLKLYIGEKEVTVKWEENESVRALSELCAEAPLTVEMSMYGGFEQVGNIGCELPRDDVQTTTSFGDIVLYSGDQIVVFYGQNSWTYTKLGSITDCTQEDMEQLLGHGDVTITISK